MVDAVGRYHAPDRWPRARGPLTDCGAIYYSRYFRLAEGASHHEGSWLLNPRGDLGYGLQHFRGDNRTFAVIFLVPAHDRELRVLRREAAWTAAAAAIRPLDAMTSAQVAQPLTGVMPMGGLSNVLRTGDPGVWRMVAVGDALCHTNPSYAFGLAFALIHASALGRAASAATDGDSLVHAYYEAVTPEARGRFAFACDTDAARVRAWKGERLDVGRADGCYPLFAFGPALAAAPHDDHVLRRTIGRIGLLERTSAFDEDHELHHRAHLRRAHRHAGYAAGTAARGAAGPGRGGLAGARGARRRAGSALWRSQDRSGGRCARPARRPDCADNPASGQERHMSKHAAGIVISTSITAGGVDAQHAEGIVVSTAIPAGGITSNHAEGVVVSTAIAAGGIVANHAEVVAAFGAGRTAGVRVLPWGRSPSRRRAPSARPQR